jgi:UDP-glucose 4-epimerase
MKRYLVTGGCGFIGSHLVERLIRNKCAVRVIDNLSTGTRDFLPQEAELIVGDVGDSKLVRAAMRDICGCFHLAAIASVAQSSQKWIESHRTNLSAVVGLFEAASEARPHPIPVVYASSAAVYGDSPVLPLNEDLPLRPLSPYGADKAACEMHARAGMSARGLSSTGLRFFNVYGPRQRPDSPYSGVITIFADRIARGERLEMYGDGEQTRDFVFVEDVTAVLWAAMQRLEAENQQPAADVFNVCSGTPTRVHDLADRLMSLSNSSVSVVHAPPRAGEIRHSTGCPAKLVEAVGRLPSTPLDEGLARTIGLW